MPLATKTVVGNLKDLQGNPASGSIVFTSPYTLKDESGNIVYVPTTIIVPLVAGQFSVDLAATNSTGILPTGWSWRVIEAISGQPSRTWHTQIDKDATSPVDYADLVEVIDPPDVGAYATVDQLNAEAATRASADTALGERIDDTETSISGLATDLSTETSARGTADAAEASARSAADTAEATARANADNELSGRIGALEATGANVTTAGNNAFTGANSFAAATTFNGAVSLASTVSATHTFTWNVPDAATSAIVINRSATVDPNTSSDLYQINYKSARSRWDNEWGGLRIRVPAQAVLGYADVALKLFEQAEGGGDGIQIFGPSDGSTPSFKSRAGALTIKSLTVTAGNIAVTGSITATGTITSTGNVSAPNINKGSWTDITIDSPTVAGRYVQSAGTAPNAFKAQARLEGGDRVYLHGQIDVVGTGAANDVIATTMPTGMIPSRRAWLPAAANGGAVSDIEVTTAGALVSRRSSLTGFLSLDGLFYDL